MPSTATPKGDLPGLSLQLKPTGSFEKVITREKVINLLKEEFSGSQSQRKQETKKLVLDLLGAEISGHRNFEDE